MLIRNWLRDVVCKEVDDEFDASSGGSDAPAPEAKPVNAYDFVDKGLDVEVDAGVKTDAPAEESAEDPTTGSDAPDETGDEAQEPDADNTADSEPAAEADEDISDDLLDRVATLGLEYSDIKQFRKASTLTAYLDQVEKIQTRMAARQQKPKDETPVAPAEEKPNVIAAKINSAKERIAKMQADGFNEDEIAVHRENLELLETLAENQRLQDEKYAQLQQFTTQQQEAQAAKAYAEAVEQFETGIEALGDEYKVLFGTGSVEKLKPAEKANRDKLWDAMNDIADIHNKRGQKVPSIATLVKKAIAMEFSDHTQQLARQKLKADLKKSGSQTITRARPVANTTGRGYEAALDRFDEAWRP